MWHSLPIHHNQTAFISFYDSTAKAFHITRYTPTSFNEKMAHQQAFEYGVVFILLYWLQTTTIIFFYQPKCSCSHLMILQHFNTINEGGSEFPRALQPLDYDEIHLAMAASAGTCNLDSVVKI